MNGDTRILIVEDEVIIGADLAMRLKQLGYHVIDTVQTGEQAIEEVKKTRPDIVLMDIILAGEMDGIETADRIRSIDQIPIVFVTAYADEERLRKAKLTLPFGYILKPFQDRDIKVAIEMALYTYRLDHERRQTEKAHIASEHKYRTLFNCIADPIVVFDKETFRFLDCNEKAIRMYGYSYEEFMSLTPMQLHPIPDHTDARAILENNRNSLLEDEFSQTKGPEEFRHISKSGEIFHVEVHTQLVDYGGRAAWLSVIRDLSGRTITEEQDDSESVEPDEQQWDGKEDRRQPGEAKSGVRFKRRIDDRVLIEEVLNTSEEKYRLIAENISDVIWLVGLDFKILYASPSIKKLLGYETREVTGTSFLKLLDNPIREEIVDTIAMEMSRDGLEGVDPERFITMEAPQIHKKGRIVYTEITASVLRDRDGKPAGILGVTRDVTQRKAAEEALRESEERFREMAELLPTVIGEYDLDLNITYVNKIGFETFGYSEEELKAGVKITDLIHPGDIEKAAGRITRVLSGEEPSSDEIRVITKDGSVLTGISSPSPIVRNGETVGVRLTFQDVTSRKKTEERLKEIEERFKQLTENILETFWISAAHELNLEYISPAFDTIWGRPREDFYENSEYFYETIHKDDRDRVVQAIKNIIEDDFDLEYRILHPDGSERWIRNRGFPVKNEAGELLRFVGTAADITNVKESEERLKATLKEKEILLSEIHHRVKNNMQVIISLLNIQAQKTADPSVQKAFLESQDRIKAMALIHEMLYSSGTASEIRIETYIKELTDSLFLTYGIAPDAIELELEAEDITLGMDQSIPCGLVLNELISNSLKHAFPDRSPGKIYVKAQSTAGGGLRIMVGDNGVGISDDIDWRNSPSLGLTLVRGLVEGQLKGKIDMETGNGAHFIIEFDPV